MAISGGRSEQSKEKLCKVDKKSKYKKAFFKVSTTIHLSNKVFCLHIALANVNKNIIRGLFA